MELSAKDQQVDVGIDGITKQFSTYWRSLLQKAHSELEQAHHLLWNLSNAEDAKTVIGLIEKMLAHPKEFIGKDHWEEAGKNSLIDLQKALTGALNKQGPFKIDRELKNRIEKSYKVIEKEINKTNGELDKTFRLVNGFLNHPTNGLLPNTFQTVRKEVKWLESQFSTFIEAQTKEASADLTEIKARLWNLLTPFPEDQDAHASIELLNKIFSNPQAYTNASNNKWPSPHVENIQNLFALLSAALEKEPFAVDRALQQQIKRTLKETVDALIASSKARSPTL